MAKQLAYYDGEQLRALAISPSDFTVVKHGTNESAERPTEFLAVYWQGSVEPLNVDVGDIAMFEGDVVGGSPFVLYDDESWGAGEMLMVESFAGGVLKVRPARGYRETVVTLGTSGTQTLDFAAANVWRIDPSGTVDFAFDNLPASGQAAPGTLIIENDGQAVTWPVGTQHPDGEPPELDGETWLSIVAVGSTVTVGRAWAGVA